MVTEFYMAGNEIADHTMTHAELAGRDEITGNLIALNALAGIPLSSIIGQSESLYPVFRFNPKSQG